MIESSSSSTSPLPLTTSHHWMKEQYFSNDYYDIYYDTKGYSVERWSVQPTHLSQRKSRCDHHGSAVPERINWNYIQIKEPIPLPQPELYNRDYVRSKRENGKMLEITVIGKKLVTIMQIGGSTYTIHMNSKGITS